MNTKKAIGGSIGSILVLLISQIAAQLAGEGMAKLKIPVGICNVAAGIFYFAAAYILLKILAEKILKISLYSVGIPRFHIKFKWIITAIILPCAVVGTYLLLPGSFVSSSLTADEKFSALSAGIAFTGIAAGFVEEMVFRGFILNLLKDRWNNKVAVMLPSLLFGAVHIIGMDFSFLSCLLVLTAGTAVGIMFSLIELESGSVWNSGIVHALWNIIIIGGVLGIGEKADKYSLITYVLKTDNFALTGGEFGIESSVIAVSAYLVVSLITLFMLRKHGSRSTI